MEILQRGHVYKLANKHEGHQTLTFFKDLPVDADDNHDGVLCQEVLRALIDRYIDLFGQMPSIETMQIIEHLRAALILGEVRAARRSLEKSYAKTGIHIEGLPVRENGHIFDLGSD